MSSDLEIYKQNRINNLNRVYVENVNKLYSTLTNNIRIVSSSFFRNKQTRINSLISKYNYEVASLGRYLKIELDKVKAFNPPGIKAITKTKKALLIGINYTDTPYSLSGCIEDTERMKALLTKHGFTQFTTLTDNTAIKPTKENIMNEFKRILISSRAGDMVFFYFSGHGSYTDDMNNEETDGKDEVIISSDLRGIIDDELKKILTMYLKKNVILVGMFDSCHSGTMLDLKYNYLDSTNYDNYTENSKITVDCPGTVLMISGCMDNETSTEAYINNKTQGAMTWAFIETLNNGPDKSWRELIKSMRTLLTTNGFSQIPQLSTGTFYNIDTKVFL